MHRFVLSATSVKAASIAATIAVATTTSAVMAPDAQAFTLTRTVNGVSYDITAISGTFTDLESQLTTQPWWGDQSSALEFASVVGIDLGYWPAPPLKLGGSTGPFFAYLPSGPGNNTYQGPFSAGIRSYYSFEGVFTDGTNFSQDSSVTFATATLTPIPGAEAVPEPSTLSAVLLSGLMMLCYRKRGQKD